MASTLEGARLTQAHAIAQTRLQRRIQADLITLWGLMDPADIDGSYPRFLRAAKAILAARKRESASIGAAYYRAFREAEGASGPLQVALMSSLADEQAETVLRVVAPVTIKTAIRGGKPLEAAMRSGLVATLGAGSRLVSAGGRDTVHETFLRDEKAVAVARVTRSGSCSFCAMLASRGPVYKSQDTAKFRAHDHCNCQTETVFDPDSYDWPGGDEQRRLSDLYAESTKDFSGRDKERAFRRAYEKSLRTA